MQNGVQICYAKLKNGLYILHTFKPESNYTEMFRVARPKSNKHKKLSNDFKTYFWHLRLGHINLDRINKLTKDGPLKDLNVEFIDYLIENGIIFQLTAPGTLPQNGAT